MLRLMMTLCICPVPFEDVVHRDVPKPLFDEVLLRIAVGVHDPKGCDAVCRLQLDGYSGLLTPRAVHFIALGCPGPPSWVVPYGGT